MKNAFFKVVKTSDGYGIKFFAPVDGGEGINIQEVMNYLDTHNLNYDLKVLKEAADKGEEVVVPLGSGECPAIRETYVLNVSEDNMKAFARFFPPSDTGERMSAAEFKNDMPFRNIRFGLQDKIIDQHFNSAGYYCFNLPIAVGKPPRHGTDARIEYYFDTNVDAKPDVKEDGTVDFFSLNLVRPCSKGQVLARIIPADEGEYGMNLQGNRLKPREVKRARLEHGANITLSEDRLSLISNVDGHVTLVGGQVFVSNVYEVENVGTATGNIDFNGSVQVNGNIDTNFVVKATGDVIVKGVVEGARVEAGGNIIISKGMKGMSKGILIAGGNVVSKFIENATVEAEGYVSTESILHSNVTSGTEITVTGKHGFITGGKVQADSLVEVRTLGAEMGASTIVEVGTNPKLKARYTMLQKEIAETVAVIKNAQPIVQNFMEKKAKGARFSEDQLNYVKQMVATIEVKKNELTAKNEELKELSAIFDPDKKSEVRVTGEVYPGTTIVIGDLSMTIQSSYRYCKFAKVAGDVKMLPL
ncbi:MAG: FapA family protein [Lachnospiraceae bacterium]|nr:FapA family protein [Lachnospiraceae bacterium]